MIQNCTATSWCVSASTKELCGTEECGWCCCSTFGFHTVPMSLTALGQEQGSLEQEYNCCSRGVWLLKPVLNNPEKGSEETLAQGRVLWCHTPHGCCCSASLTLPTSGFSPSQGW